MSQYYFETQREDSPYSLPDLEVFESDYFACDDCGELTLLDGDDDGSPCCGGCGREVPQSEVQSGWFWWACFPGCLPDGEPIGPHASEEDALDDARDGLEEG